MESRPKELFAFCLKQVMYMHVGLALRTFFINSFQESQLRVALLIVELYALSMFRFKTDSLFVIRTGGSVYNSFSPCELAF